MSAWKMQRIELLDEGMVGGTIYGQGIVLSKSFGDTVAPRAIILFLPEAFDKLQEPVFDLVMQRIDLLEVLLRSWLALVQSDGPCERLRR
jgi:hypothetical protein